MPPPSPTEALESNHYFFTRSLDQQTNQLIVESKSLGVENFEEGTILTFSVKQFLLANYHPPPYYAFLRNNFIIAITSAVICGQTQLNLLAKVQQLRKAFEKKVKLADRTLHGLYATSLLVYSFSVLCDWVHTYYAVAVSHDGALHGSVNLELQPWLAMTLIGQTFSIPSLSCIYFKNLSAPHLQKHF